MRSWWWVLCAGVAVACGRGGATPPNTTRDSLGISIVENRAPSVTGMRLSVSSNPVVDLGGDALDPHQEFSGFVFPIRLADGRIAVANGGSNDLRFFSANGTHERTVGRTGSGPGEFDSLGWLYLMAGDTLVTYDWGLKRFTLFAADGSLVRTIQLQTTSIRPLGVLDDGRFVARSQGIVDMNSSPGVSRETVVLQLFDRDGRAADSLAQYPGSERYMERSGQGFSVQDRPFGQDLVATVHGSHIIVAPTDHPSIDMRRADGSLERIVRWRRALVPVTPDDKASYIANVEAELAMLDAARRQRQLDRLGRIPFPDSKPVFAGLLVQDDGSVWVQQYTEPDREASAAFDVFGPDGQWSTVILVPPGFTPTHVAGGYLTGVWRDADGVPHVRSYLLTLATG